MPAFLLPPMGASALARNPFSPRLQIFAFKSAAALMVVLTAQTPANAAPVRQDRRDLCEAIDASAEQIEKDGHYLVAVTAQLYKQTSVANEIQRLVPTGDVGKFAATVADSNEKQAELAEKVAKDNFAVAEKLRSEYRRLCGDL